MGLFSFVFALNADAKNSDYYMGKGRIALSSDGNMHDNDDQLSTKMSLMILAKAGLQYKTTLYTYADHIWGSEDNDLEVMRRSAEETGARFGFTSCKFVPAVERAESAYSSMAKEIRMSSAENPLFIIAGGPMHVIGTALERANKKSPEALEFVTVISHSTWNNSHSDNYTKKKGKRAGEEPHFGWTWEELKDAFGDRVNFKRISDQNGRGVGADVYKNRDKFSAPSWDKWDWMAKHADKNVQWVRDNTGIKCGPDYPDAGMAYYLVADLDGKRGDEFGNPEKLRRWIGKEPIPTK